MPMSAAGLGATVAVSEARTAVATMRCFNASSTLFVVDDELRRDGQAAQRTPDTLNVVGTRRIGTRRAARHKKLASGEQAIWRIYWQSATWYPYSQ